MKVSYSNSQKYKLKKLVNEEMKVILDALTQYESILREICQVTTAEENYKDWSVIVLILSSLLKKNAALNLPKHHSFSLHLHELFIFHEALLIYQNQSGKYEQSVCRDLIMQINPLLPRTDSTKKIQLKSSI